MFLTPDPDRPVVLNGRRRLVLARGSDIDVNAFVDAFIAQRAVDSDLQDLESISPALEASAWEQP